MSTQQPNILIITTDQQRTDSLSCYGSTFTDTPHLDKFASEGVCFERAYCEIQSVRLLVLPSFQDDM